MRTAARTRALRVSDRGVRCCRAGEELAAEVVVRCRVALSALCQAADAQRFAQANEAKYVVKTYNRPPIVFTRGKGCVLYDTNGACPHVLRLARRLLVLTRLRLQISRTWTSRPALR